MRSMVSQTLSLRIKEEVVGLGETVEVKHPRALTLMSRLRDHAKRSYSQRFVPMS